MAVRRRASALQLGPKPPPDLKVDHELGVPLVELGGSLIEIEVPVVATELDERLVTPVLPTRTPLPLVHTRNVRYPRTF